MATFDASGTSTFDKPPAPGWALWSRQVRALVAISLRKALLGKSSILYYAVAAAPVLIMLVMVVVKRPGGDPLFDSVADARRAYAMIFQTVMLRGLIFFGCVGIFTTLFRGEVLDRSLHFLFLSPLRREVLVVGKYLAGLSLSSVLFCASVAVSYLLIYPPFGFSRAIEDFTSGPGGGQLLAYLGVTLLACLGYGAVFLILGLLFNNPIVPAAIVLGWESLHFLLPPALKKISVIHYLKGLVPVPMSEGPFAVVSEPPPAWLSVAGLLGLTVLVLVVGSILVKRFEISYSDE